MKGKRRNEDVALFRYSVIASLMRRSWRRGERRQEMERLSEQSWTDPRGRERRIPVGTIKDWARKYRALGFDGLYPRKRSDRGRSRRLTKTQIEKLIRFRKAFPKLTVVQLTERMVIEGFLAPGEVSIPTLHRIFRQHGVSRRDLAVASESRDCRPFQFAHRNECWQVDALHGPKFRIGEKMTKTYLIAFIDDATRVVPAARFSRYENTEALASVFCSAVRKRGIPARLYADNGRIFRSRALKLTCARLNIEQIHSRPYRPEGRGKVERFFRTVRQNFLTPYLASNPKGDLRKLNAAFDRWLDASYHSRTHRGLGGRSPIDAWVGDDAIIRTLPSSMDIERSFLSATTRKVRKDCTIHFNNIRFETDPEYRLRKVTLRFDAAKPEEVFLEDDQGHLHKLRLVDLLENSRIRRKKRGDK